MARTRLDDARRQFVEALERREIPEGSTFQGVEEETGIISYTPPGRGTLEALTPDEQAQIQATEAEWATTHIQLSNGDWVAKDKFEALPPDEQAKLMELGVDKFNEAAEAQFEQDKVVFETANVQLGTGEWVDKVSFDALTPEQQAQLKVMGVDAFNVTQQEAQAQWEAEHVKLDNEEWVVKEDFDKLTPEQQTQLRTLGVESFNAAQQEALEQFEQDNVKLDTGEWVDRASYNGMTESMQNTLNSIGVTAFNDAVAEALQQLEPYKTGENIYDIAAAIVGGYSVNTLVNLGFADAVQTYQAMVEIAPYLENHPPAEIIYALNSIRNATQEHAYSLGDSWGLSHEQVDAIRATTAEVAAQIIAGLQDLPSPTPVEVLPVGYTGTVEPFQARIEDVFREMQTAGTIPQSAILQSYDVATGEISYQLPPQEQFDFWKANDPNAPADAVYEGEAEDGGFSYSAASAAIVSIETAGGTKELKLSEWEKMSEMEQFEFILGRPPILTEWVAYCLAREGADLNWSIANLPGMRTIQGALEQLFIPGEQKTEKWLRVRDEAADEWYRAYPKLAKEGIISTSFEELGFPAVKAMYPQIAIKDITGREWAETGLSVALWTMPLWLGKALAGIKTAGGAVFRVNMTTKTLVVRLQKPIIKTDLGLSGIKTTVRSPITVRMGAGLQRAGLSPTLERVAFKAGDAATALRSVVKATNKAMRTNAVLPAEMASKLKTAQLGSLSADTKFIQALNGLRLTAKQIKLLEKTTGYRGLLKPIRNVGRAVTNLKTVWGTASESYRTVLQTAKMYGQNSANYGAAMRGYIKSLNRVTRARTTLGKAVDALDDVLKPRYAESPPAPKFSGYRMKWGEPTTGEMFLEGPAPKSAIPPKGPYEPGGGSGSGGTMSREFFEKQQAAMFESWRRPQPWESRPAPATLSATGGELKNLKRGWQYGEGRTRPSVTEPSNVEFWASHTGEPKLQLQTQLQPVLKPTEAAVGIAEKQDAGMLLALSEYKVPTLSKLTLIAKYATQLADDVRVSGRPLFNARGNPLRLPITIPASIGDVMPAIIPATVATVINGLGLTTQQLSGEVSLTPAQLTSMSNVLGVKPATVTKLSSAGDLSKALVKQMYAVGNQIVQLTDVQTNELVSVLADTQVQPVTVTQVQALAEVLDLTKTDTRTLLRTMTELATRSATATEAQTATKTATELSTAIMTGAGRTVRTSEGISVKPSLGLILPGGEGVATDEQGRPILPSGTYTWLQGIGWRSLLPPYDAKKPLWTKLPPVGAKTGGRTPQETIQIINPTGREPKSLSVDLGVTDIFIRGGGKGVRPTIEFKAHGMKTDVGRRIPGPEKGLSLEVEPIGILEPVPNALPRRSQAPKKRKKQRSWQDEVGTLKGYRF